MAVPKLKVNLVAEMRKRVTDPRKRRALTPILKRPEVKLEIGNRIIDNIIERTLDGKDKNDKGFAPYSKSYRQSDTFKIWKGGKRKPDLKLTGAMQASIYVHKLTPNGFELWFRDKEERAKASGHINGDNPNRMPIRDFWGLPNEDELDKIINEAVKSIETERIEAELGVLEAILGTTELEVGQQPAFGF